MSALRVVFIINPVAGLGGTVALKGSDGPAVQQEALAKGARDIGGQIYRNTNVTAITRTTSGEWKVTTDKGEVICEHVVSATGNFARRTGEMVGLDIPVKVICLTRNL